MTTAFEGETRTVGDFVDSQWDKQFEKYSIPSYMREGLRLYIEKYIPTGDFLMAVLKNDLKEACIRADETNRRHLFNYINFLYNEAPSACWGSPAKVQEWIETARS